MTVLIVAKCNVNNAAHDDAVDVCSVLIVAKCNVNMNRKEIYLKILISINSSKV